MYRLHFKLKSFDLEALNQIQNYLFLVFDFLKLNLTKQQINPKKLKKITVLRSPHIDKKSREQFQIVTHSKTLVQLIPKKKTLLVVLEILKDLKLIGVELEVSIEFVSYCF